MALEADLLADRRRLKRRLRLWRLAAIAIATVALAWALGSTSLKEGLIGRADQIARVSITGIITDDREQQALFDKIADESAVKAIVLHIDSPGGTTAGSEALYAAIRRAASGKPLVAVVGDVAASGGYIAALGGDHIVARGNSITGSIGVIFQWAEVTQLLDNLGVSVSQLKSSDLKAEPDLIAPTPEAALEVTQAMVDDAYEWFVALVEERRALDDTRLHAASDGRVFSGRQALEAGLIDAIGGERTALEWLVAERGVDADLKIVDWSADNTGNLSISDLVLSWGLSKLGLEELRTLLGIGQKTSPIERLSLDGLISVWHPDL